LAAVLEAEVDDPGIADVVVTGVRVSKDLRHARVFVHSPAGSAKSDELVRRLESARGFLRHQLSIRLAHLRRTPELSFTYDHSVEAGLRIEQLLADFPKPEDTGTSDREE
jgi:ribosome-binding factor A